LIPLKEESRKYTGFIIDGHVFQFRVVPFGLSTSSAALVRAMQVILGRYEDFCVHYIDDILIFSKDVESHQRHVCEILGALSDSGMKINKTKCELFLEEVKYLGYNLNKIGISVEPERLESIKNYPKPKNIRKLRGFLGLVNYYKRFIPDMAGQLAPLFAMLKKEQKFTWTPERNQAFEQVRKIFHEHLNLIHPNFDKGFILKTDASDEAISGVLVQMEGEIEQPIYFASRILQKSEKCYTVTEKELLAIVYCVNKLKYYLMGRHFLIQSDHAALTALIHTRFANNRVYRWSLFLQEYSFTIQYVKGDQNVVADTLSRMYNMGESTKQVEVNQYNAEEATGIYNIEYIKREQQKDELKDSRRLAELDQGTRGYFLEQGILKKRTRGKHKIVITRDMVQQIATEIHQDYGHSGIRKTWMMLREEFYGKNDLSVIKDQINRCEQCIYGKDKNVTCKNIVQSNIPIAPLDVVAIDYLGNLIPGTFNYKHILVMVDVFSKYVMLIPTKECNTITSIRCIEKFIQQVGKPKRILADNGSYFTNRTFKDALKEKGILYSFTTVRHPQSNLAERFVQETIKYLRMLTHHQHNAWFQYVPQVEQFINHTPSVVTEVPPITLMKNIIPKRPWREQEQIEPEIGELIEKCRRKIQERARKYTEKENLRIKKRTELQIGDLVILRRYRLGRREQNKCAKLDLPFEGPLRIVKKFGINGYELADLSGTQIKGRYHINMIHPYRGDQK
jgi:transposase InsO family protein